MTSVPVYSGRMFMPVLSAAVLAVAIVASHGASTASVIDNDSCADDGVSAILDRPDRRPAESADEGWERWT